MAIASDILEVVTGFLRPVARHAEARVVLFPGSIPGRPSRAKTAETSRIFPKNQWCLIRRFLGNFLVNVWREPFFYASRPGRLFLTEGYSAQVMRTIYERGQEPEPWTEAVFHNHPLHRALFDRQQIVSRLIRSELIRRLSQGRAVSILTAPSGHALDVLIPVRTLFDEHPEWRGRISVTACDLDPQGTLEPFLREQTQRLGMGFAFIRGDISTSFVRNQAGQQAPFDMVLIVGLSSWLPKPHMMEHCRWVRACLAHDGVFLTDCFTSGTHPPSRRFAGYRANYYAPSTYTALLDSCGFDGTAALVEKTENGMNHVIEVRKRPPRLRRASGRAMDSRHCATRKDGYASLGPQTSEVRE